MPCLPVPFAPVLLVVLAAFAASACDDQIKVRNVAPEVALEGWCEDSGRTYFELTVQDLEEDLVDVELRVGGTVPILVGPTGDGTFGLRSDRDYPGNYHWIEWASGSDDCLPEPDAGGAAAGGAEGLCAVGTGVCMTAERQPAPTCAPLDPDAAGERVTIRARDRRGNESSADAGELGALGVCDFTKGRRE